MDEINLHIQSRLKLEGLLSVSAVQAAQWLDEAGLLKDSTIRRGRPLRDLLRQGHIASSWQDARHRWFIDRSE
jgi:hypothetical protein